jgi:hypothetical protein
MSKRVWGVVIGVVVLAIFGFVISVFTPGRIINPMPSPNGYDDLVAAGKLVSGEIARMNADFSGVKTEQLQRVVAENAEALERARVGLARESRVRLPASVDHPDLVQNTSRLRILSRLLASEAVMHERAGDVPKAAAVNLEILKLAASAGTGGLMIDSLGSIGIEIQGLLGLSRVAPELSAEDARRLAAELMRIDRERESTAVVNARDLAYYVAKGPWQLRVMKTFTPGQIRKMRQPSEAGFETAEQRAHAYRRLLAVKLTLAVYRLDHPEAPVPLSLDALVPGELDAVPVDPYAKDNGPLRLHVDAEGKTAHVYSVGPDGKDDGGAPTPPGTIVNAVYLGDLTLDLP